MTLDSLFIDINQFIEVHNNSNIRLIDSTWHMPNLDRDAKAEYQKQHIKAAQFFDIDAVADTSINLPHMLPSAEIFSKEMDRMGISMDDHVIIYDAYGFFSAARTWWTFKIMGHDNVSILNGGLKKWIADGHTTTDKPAKIEATAGYKASIDQKMMTDYVGLNKHIDQNDRQILDARSKARFEGSAPEPRPELPSGHMPNALNLSFDQLSNADGTIKSKSELEQLVQTSGIDISAPIITTCGSGITAANLFVALTIVGAKEIALYDGSWTEYASRPESRIHKTN